MKRGLSNKRKKKDKKRKMNRLYIIFERKGKKRFEGKKKKDDIAKWRGGRGTLPLA